jgi:hypothetical protein
LTAALAWSLAFLNRGERSTGGMPSPGAAPDAAEELREVVPARAVLTELARGFLLVRENDRARAVRFAVTFLRERTEPDRPRAPAAYPVPSVAQRSLGRSPRGAVERPDPRGAR